MTTDRMTAPYGAVEADPLERPPTLDMPKLTKGPAYRLVLSLQDARSAAVELRAHLASHCCDDADYCGAVYLLHTIDSEDVVGFLSRIANSTTLFLPPVLSEKLRKRVQRRRPAPTTKGANP